MLKWRDKLLCDSLAWVFDLCHELQERVWSWESVSLCCFKVEAHRVILFVCAGKDQSSSLGISCPSQRSEDSTCQSILLFWQSCYDDVLVI